MTKIVFATDLSVCSQATRRHAAELALRMGAKILGLYVLRPPIPVYFHSLSLEPYRREIEERQRLRLREFLKPLEKRKIPYEAHLRLGATEQILHQFVAEEGGDLVVVSRHSCPESAQQVLGSTTEKILRQAEVPVLVDFGKGTLKFEHFVCAVDLSGYSASVLRMAAALARKCRANLTVLYVIVLDVATETLSSKLHTHLEVAVEKTQRRLEELMESSQLQVNGQAVVTTGRPDVAIRDYLKRGPGDLLVLGTRGQGLADSFGIGTTARALLRTARVPVLMVPPCLGVKKAVRSDTRLSETAARRQTESQAQASRLNR